MNNKQVVKLILEKMLEEKVLTHAELTKIVQELKDNPKQEKKKDNGKSEPWMKEERQKLANSLEDGINATGKIIEGAWDSLTGKK